MLVYTSTLHACHLRRRCHCVGYSHDLPMHSDRDTALAGHPFRSWAAGTHAPHGLKKGSFLAAMFDRVVEAHSLSMGLVMGSTSRRLSSFSLTWAWRSANGHRFWPAVLDPVNLARCSAVGKLLTREGPTPSRARGNMVSQNLIFRDS